MRRWRGCWRAPAGCVHVVEHCARRAFHGNWCLIKILTTTYTRGIITYLAGARSLLGICAYVGRGHAYEIISCGGGGPWQWTMDHAWTMARIMEGLMPSSKMMLLQRSFRSVDHKGYRCLCLLSPKNSRIGIIGGCVRGGDYVYHMSLLQLQIIIDAITICQRAGHHAPSIIC